MINSRKIVKRYSSHVKQSLLLFLIAFLFSGSMVSQSCLPEGITFSTQAEIDGFSSNYPGCVTILGDVTIRESVRGTITDLNGLSQLNAISGTLKVHDNFTLKNLSGLDNVTSIGGDFWVGGDYSALESFSGLENLTSIGGSLLMLENDSLTTVSALSNLTAIGEDLDIWAHEILPTLNGLDNLTAINGHLKIRSNEYLTDLSGLEGIGSVGGDLEITSNLLLTDLSELSNMTTIGGDLKIAYNPALASLDGLDNVTSVGMGLWIYDNPVLVSLIGLSKVPSFGADVRISLNPALVTLGGLDNVTSIAGQLQVSTNASLINLTGLNQVASVGGQLIIGSNAALTSLSGLDNLISIGGQVSISSNPILSSLNGLDQVASISGRVSLYNNPVLTSLSALKDLTSIGGDLSIRSHASLMSLDGLDNIDPSSITDLRIENSGNLAMCSVPSICEYLSNPGNPATISGNATGCNSTTEIQSNCSTCTADTIVINDNPIPDNTEIFAADWIKSAGVIEAGSMVSMQAQNYILAQPGFHAKVGSEVHLKIGDCPTTATSIAVLPETKIAPAVKGNLLILYPNPASTEVNIRYKLTTPQQVSIYLQSLGGQRMQYLLRDIPKEPGMWELMVDCSPLSAGMYLAILETENERIVKKLVIFKS